LQISNKTLTDVNPFTHPIATKQHAKDNLVMWITIL